MKWLSKAIKFEINQQKSCLNCKSKAVFTLKADCRLKCGKIFKSYWIQFSCIVSQQLFCIIKFLFVI